MRQISSATPALNSWGRPAVFLGPGFGPNPDNSVFGTDTDGKVAAMLASGAGVENYHLPVVAVGDSFGRIVYFSQGYNTSLAEDLRSVIDKL